MNRRNLAAVSMAALLCSSVFVMTETPAEARVSAGNISLRVTGKCPALGDSIVSFAVWTPEKGLRRISSGKSGTIDFGTFRKTVSGDTFFNWSLDCRYSGKSGSHQKRYGGNLFQTGYSFSVANDKGRIKYP